MAERVTIFEVGPRDGLQNEPATVATADKIRLVDALSVCGLAKIEVTSFVSPKWVPKLADAADVLAGISRVPELAYAALTSDLRGFEDAVAAGADEVAICASASEGFSRKSINSTIKECLTGFQPVAAAARRVGIPMRGHVSCVTDCPFDGPTSPTAVARVVATLLDLGCYEVCLGDTIGAATPVTVAAMLEWVLTTIPADRLAGHFHDTNGRALANIAISLDRGLRVFDSSVAGFGGCPYAPGAKGNVATEAVVRMLHARGYDTGVDLQRLADAAAFARTLRSVP